MALPRFVPGGIYLHHYAADLARAPDGEWWVLGDRTQGPSGTGYTLQNRIILSRTFPDAFRDLKVQTLASFFRASQEGMSRLAPTDGEAPLAVLLTLTFQRNLFRARLPRPISRLSAGGRPGSDGT